MPSLDAFGIVCADIAKSVKFYNLLGLDFPDAGDDHIEATAKNGMRVMLDKLELIKEVDATYAKVTKAGFRGKTEPFDAFWGQRYATVFDPDGNAVDLFAQL